VHAETDPKYHALITKFKELTSCPVLVNTSFNVSGEPIAAASEDAFGHFMGTEIDWLVCGNAVLRKEHHNPAFAEDCKNKHELD
jgi:carbamoyltransferase